MITYEKKTSDTMYLFIGAKPGQSALFFDQLGVGPNSTYEKWTDLGHLMFLDLQGAGYTTTTKTPKSIVEYTYCQQVIDFKILFYLHNFHNLNNLKVTYNST